MNGNPQVDNGYTQIAHELLEALAKAMAQGTITGKERAIIDWIIRYTYGYQKTNGFFHTSFIAKNLGLSMSWVSQILKSLETKKIIFRKGIEIKFNKHYLEWSKHLEPSKQHLEPSKQYLEPSKQEKPKQQQIEPCINGEKNNPKDNYINITKDSSLTENSLKEKTNEEENSQTVAKVKGSEMQELIKKFCETMGYEYNPISIRLNVKPAKELLQTYTIDEIIEAVEYGKRKYKKENRDSKVFITNLQAVLNSVVRWRGGVKEEIEMKEKNKKGGYIV